MKRIADILFIFKRIEGDEKFIGFRFSCRLEKNNFDMYMRDVNTQFFFIWIGIWKLGLCINWHHKRFYNP